MANFEIEKFLFYFDLEISCLVIGWLNLVGSIILPALVVFQLLKGSPKKCDDATEIDGVLPTDCSIDPNESKLLQV
jgi:hypothetical protein